MKIKTLKGEQNMKQMKKKKRERLDAIEYITENEKLKKDNKRNIKHDRMKK